MPSESMGEGLMYKHSITTHPIPSTALPGRGTRNEAIYEKSIEETFCVIRKALARPASCRDGKH